jgi:hypothetical protein
VSVHIISPGVSSTQVSGGGTSLFRGLAVVLAGLTDVVAYEPVVRETMWRHPRVATIVHHDPQEAIEQVMSAAQAGDVVVKVAGALPGHWDMICDLELARLRRATNLRLIYCDADAPSRLPILQYAGSYLDAVLPAANAVIVWGGGPRAAHAYRGLTDSPVVSLTLAVTWFGVPLPDDADHVGAAWDVAAIFGGDVSRGARVSSLLSALAAQGMTIGFAGREPQNLPAGVSRLGFLDGRELATLIKRSRFTLSLLRDDVKGYADVHACRMIEAARLGSLLISDPFPGLARLFVPGRDLVVLEDDPRVTLRRLAALSASEHREMTSRACSRVAAAADREARLLATAVLGTKVGSRHAHR